MDYPTRDDLASLADGQTKGSFPQCSTTLVWTGMWIVECWSVVDWSTTAVVVPTSDLLVRASTSIPKMQIFVGGPNDPVPKT